MKIIFFICLLFVSLSLNSFSQEKTVPDSASIKIQQLEEKLNRKVDSLTHEDEHLREIIKFGYENVKEESHRTLTTIKIVLAVFAVFIAIMGIFIALIGIFIAIEARKYIRKKVEEKIDKHVLEVKNEFILRASLENKKTKKFDERPTTPETKKNLREYIKLVISKDEKDYTADDWFWLAYYEDENGNYGKAIEYYTKATEKNPDYSSAYFNRGLIFTKEIIDYNKAIKDFTKVIYLKPDDAEAYKVRGISYVRDGNLKNAIIDFKDAINLEPDNISSFMNLIQAYIINNDCNKGLEYLNEAYALKLKDNDKAILKYYECLMNKMLGNNTNKLTRELNAILKKEFEITWSFGNIKNWLKDVKLSDDIKEYVKEKTELLKKKIKK